MSRAVLVVTQEAIAAAAMAVSQTPFGRPQYPHSITDYQTDMRTLLEAALPHLALVEEHKTP